MKQRDYSLDYIRVAACFMVVLMHSPIPSNNADGFFLTALSYFTAPCIGLFFMVSGALLIPVKTNFFSFLRRRFTKIIVPTIIWSFIYIGLRLYNNESELNLLQALGSILFSAQGNGVLWFMYTLAGLYMLAPILSSWLEQSSRREVEAILLLWSITLCYPILDLFLIINTSTTGILYYFTGYAGYFVLGYYMKKYSDGIRTPFTVIIAIVGPSLLLTMKYYHIEFDFYQLFWYQSIFIAALCVITWKTIVKLVYKIHLHRIITQLSNLSFGIYLCHILIMRRGLWDISWIKAISNYPLQTFVICIVTFITSIALCYILSRLPFANLLIGYKYSKK